MNKTDISGFKELYPFESHFLKIEGHNYHYVDEGAGEPVVMVHGNPTWSFYFRNLISALKDSGYRAVAPDHIGCGLSDKPRDYEYKLSNHISNLEYLIETLGLKNITLIVHDWGGPIGMGYATRHPENIKKLVISNTAAWRSNLFPFRINLCRIPVFGTIAVRCFNAFARAAVRMAVSKQERMTPEVKLGYLAPYGNYHDRIATLRFVEDVPFSKNDKSYSQLVEIEEKLALLKKKPMLIAWGAQDFCFRIEFLKKWRFLFPDADIRNIPDAGHYVLEDAHERIIPWIKEFLKK
ncbi:MAG TPA: alpha/beta fold hydrolase [Candidatus Wallbacteria bacterium]|nr:alpha/beta fold hydrolase [Candidatus Wallbacteria bacterium]